MAWTDGMQLAACGLGGAWCMAAPLNQELLQEADATPATLTDFGWSTVLRVRADGQQDRLMINRPVRALHAAAEAVVIEVDDDPWRLRHLGVDTYEVLRTSPLRAVAVGRRSTRPVGCHRGHQYRAATARD
ncbi:hypothetical protein [Nakamurella panacisegetis]|uniref:hypothetical protein n=1 Tax=Nakamurella panacisegetis TaxID=1090615 RepID=UPI000B80E353|nr:hypothetical protein [Nakamurella panacisegetis]